MAGDTRSVMSYSDALTALKASDVTVYVVGFLENQGAREKLEQRMRLTQIAEATGGLAFFPGTKKDIDLAYEQVQADVNSRYLIGYISSNQANDGRWRKLDVRLNRPDLKAAKIRARKGYFALMRPERSRHGPSSGRAGRHAGAGRARCPNAARPGCPDAARRMVRSAGFGPPSPPCHPRTIASSWSRPSNFEATSHGPSTNW